MEECKHILEAVESKHLEVMLNFAVKVERKRGISTSIKWWKDEEGQDRDYGKLFK